MALLNSLSLLLALQVSSTYAQGLEGYGLTSYDPVCAEACLRSFTPLMLPCSSMHDGHMATPPACRANDTAFLTSVAWLLGGVDYREQIRSCKVVVLAGSHRSRSETTAVSA
ncbi:hypothetical protein LB505_013139 [Fusarium chuoi]|nr:hypothetical protein LB505_013139 [Fusarium chuoi]